MDEIKTMIEHILKTRMINLRELSTNTGVGFSTLDRIMSGKAKWCYVNTYIKILDYKNKPEEYNQILYVAPGYEPLRNARVWYD